jgi:hypothetical protein
MSDPRWLLIDRVRETSYDLFCYDEKLRMHNLVVRLKSHGTVSDDNLEWLRVVDANLRCVAALTGTFRRRRRWRADG